MGAGTIANPARTPIPTTVVRITGACIMLACIAMLSVGASLKPNQNGYGTHTSIGLPPCGWAAATGTPCASCGMTTAVTHVSHGDFASGFVTQPAGALVAIAASVALWAGTHALATGAHTGAMFGFLLRPTGIAIIVGIILAAWAYKWVTWN